MACFNSSNLIFKRGTLRYKPPEVNGITEYDGIKGDIFYLASALMILTTGGAAFKILILMVIILNIYMKKILIYIGIKSNLNYLILL